MAADGTPEGQGPTKVIGGYELLAKVGTGGMGAVYKARQASLDRVVALKILPPRLARDQDFLARFFREARAAGRLNHPNVVAGIDVGEADGYFYFAMEYVEGETVGDILRRDGGLSETRSIEIVRQVAGGLAHAHKQNLIHRDIKPDNILIDADGAAKLCDLGLARSTVDEDATVTQAGTAIGTPFYIAPEQARGERDLDARTDVYGLGATLFHMVAGVPVFEGQTSAVIMAKHLNEPPPELSKVAEGTGAGLSAVVAKCLEKEPGRRYQSMTNLVDDLDRVASGERPAAMAGRVRRASASGEARGRSAASRGSVVAMKPGSGSGPMAIGLTAAVVIGLVLFVIFGRGGVSTTKRRPLIESPRSTEQKTDDGNIKEMFEYARKYAEGHAEDYDGALSKFEAVRKAASGTKYQLMAADAIKEITSRRDEAVKKAAAGLRASSDALAARRDFDGAVAVWTELPSALAGAMKPDADRETAALRSKAEGLLRTAEAEANRHLGAGRASEALKALDAVRNVKYSAWDAKLTHLRARARQAQASAADTVRQRASAAARAKLAAYLVDFEKAVAGGDLKAAGGALRRAEADASLRGIAAEVKPLADVAAALGKSGSAERAAIEALKDGRKHSFQTTKGTMSGIVKKVTAEEIVLSVEGMMNRKAFIYEKRLRMADLTAAARARLRGGTEPKTRAEHVARAARELAEKDLAGAEGDITAAGAHPCAAPCQRVLDGLRMGQVEAAAKSAWAAVVKSGRGKLTAASAKTLLTKIAGFEKAHGATKYAASVAGDIAALKGRAGLVGGWRQLAVDSIPVDITGGARVSTAGGVLIATVPQKDHVTLHLLPPCGDFQMKFEYNGPLYESFMRLAGYHGSVNVIVAKDVAVVRSYPQPGPHGRRSIMRKNQTDIAPPGWHMVEVGMKGRAFSLKLDGKVISSVDDLQTVLRGETVLYIWDTKGADFRLRNVAVNILDKPVRVRKLDDFEANQWKSIKANCRVDLRLIPTVKRTGRHSLELKKAEDVIHDGMISRPVRLPPGAKGLRFWVARAVKGAPKLGVFLRAGGTNFSFDSSQLSSAMAEVPPGEWRHVEVPFDTTRMTTWPKGGTLDLAKIDTLVIKVGDNKTTQGYGQAVYIDDMEVLIQE